MPFQLINVLLALVSLSACANLSAGASGAIPQASCRAAGAESVLGQTVDDKVISDATVGSGAMRSRVIRPGANVTLELDPLRLNLEVDESGRVRRLRCG
jgi:hypothetical protein